MWKLSLNKEAIGYYKDFKDGVYAFLRQIHHHYASNEYGYDICHLPFSLGACFHGKYDDFSITDEEIIVSSRLNMLLNCLYSPFDNINQDSADAIQGLENTQRWFCDDSDDFEITFEKDRDTEETSLSIKDEKDNLFVSNAFHFDEEKIKEYFFTSSQKIICVDSKDSDLLGTRISVDIELKEVKY